MRPCLDCGEVSESTRCEACSPTTTEMRGLTFRQRGYDAAWDRLSRRARALQPFCSDCGRRDQLTADHLPSAWERKARGLALRLVDVDVVCRECNLRRGSSRPGTPRALGGGPDPEAQRAGAQGRILDSLGATSISTPPSDTEGVLITPAKVVHGHPRQDGSVDDSVDELVQAVHEGVDGISAGQSSASTVVHVSMDASAHPVHASTDPRRGTRWTRLDGRTADGW